MSNTRLINCPSCQNLISPSAKHCPKCGNKKPMHTLYKICLIMLLAVVLILGYMFLPLIDQTLSP